MRSPLNSLSTFSHYVRTEQAHQYATSASLEDLVDYCRLRRLEYFSTANREGYARLQNNLAWAAATLRGREPSSRFGRRYFTHLDWHNAERLLLAASLDRIKITWRVNGSSRRPPDLSHSSGRIVFAPHFGAYTFALARIAFAEDTRVNVLLGRDYLSAVDMATIANIQRIPNTKVLMAAPGVIEAILQCARNGETVIMFSDRANVADRSRNVRVRFFTKWLLAQPGIGIVAAQIRVPIDALWFVRQLGTPKPKYLAYWHRITDGSQRQPAAEVVQAVYSVLETIVFRWPHLWERWKYFDFMVTD